MLNGLHPAVVHSYNASEKTCEITLVGVTDGTQEKIIAEIAFPIGDKSAHTDIRILSGDTVWVEFMGGDMRHPIITHFRTKRTGNQTAWRKLHHANIDLTADDVLVLKASTIKIIGDVVHTGSQSTSGNMAVVGELKNDGVNVGKTHTHNGVQVGGQSTGTPQ